MKYRHAMTCEVCNQRIRFRNNFQTTSKEYKEWIKNTKEVLKHGMGAPLCWNCHKQN